MPNLFEDLTSDLSKEVIEFLAQSKNVRIERIVSFGQSSPDGFWYDQSRVESFCSKHITNRSFLEILEGSKIQNC